MKPISITDETFVTEVLNSDRPVLIDFWAVWCGPCKMIAPIIDEIAQEYNDKLKVCKLDVDSNPKTAMQFGIRSIPTLLIIKDGQVVEQIIGAIPKNKLVDKILNHIS